MVFDHCGLVGRGADALLDDEDLGGGFLEGAAEEQDPVATEHPGPLAFMVGPIAVMSIATVLIGLFGEPLFEFSQRAADQLLNPEGYISAVLVTGGEGQ